MSLEKLKQFLELELKNKKILDDGLSMIKSLDGLNQLAKEAKEASGKAVAEKDVIVAELDVLKKSLKTQKDKADAVVAKADKTALEVIGEAKVEAEKILTEAQSKVAKAKSELEGLEAKKKAIEEAVSLAKAEHDLIDGKIAQLKSDLKGFVGG